MHVHVPIHKLAGLILSHSYIIDDVDSVTQPNVQVLTELKQTLDTEPHTFDEEIIDLVS